MTLAAVIAAAADRLSAAGFGRDDAHRDAAILARAILGWSAAEWLSHSIDRAPPGFAARLDDLVTRRTRREPVAYLVGEREFYGRPFRVTRDVLIPRPETELVVEEALAILRRMAATGRSPVVVDVGTGSGCIAVTLALEVPSARVIATDCSAAALRMARANGTRLGASDRVEWRAGDLLAGVSRCDVVVSNPPYVPDTDRPSLQPDVRDFEPATALFGGADGLAVVRRLIGGAAPALVPGGSMVLELGVGQADEVAALLEHEGFSDVRIRPDWQGIGRVAVAGRPAASL